jgi:LysM repeat protein
MTKANASVVLTLAAAALLLLTACGEVVTPRPPTELPSNATSTPTPTHAGPGSGGTAPPLPPADTVTPTVSPTPIVYVVKSGDTLLGIALEYGVSVEALQAANGIEDPQFLRVGQELLIPTGKEESEGSTGGLLLPTPTPLPIEVQGLAFYETPVGSLWCLGEMVNTTASSITNVQVRVTLFDAAGQRVGEEDAFVAADLILPDERSPFGILFVDPPAGWTTPQITVIRAEAAGELAASIIPLSIVTPEGSVSGPQFEISGTVENDTAGQGANRVSVVATTYNQEGQVTGFRQETIPMDEPLESGGTMPFTMLFAIHGEELADFRILALGYTSAE